LVIIQFFMKLGSMSSGEVCNPTARMTKFHNNGQPADSNSEILGQVGVLPTQIF
jgi:hypothetical protein